MTATAVDLTFPPAAAAAAPQAATARQMMARTLLSIFQHREMLKMLLELALFAIAHSRRNAWPTTSWKSRYASCNLFTSLQSNAIHVYMSSPQLDVCTNFLRAE